MRIIGGKYKGRTLIAPKGNLVRPTSDRTKEAIFNLIQFEVAGKRVLDLFAGSGALGIEALSRGANEASFCDANKDSIAAINKNLAKIGVDSEVYCKDYRQALKAASLNYKKYDIIFLDPPYNKGLEGDALLLIEKYDLLSDEGLIVIERSTQEQSYDLPYSYIMSTSRAYGAATIDILRKGTKAVVTGTFDPFTEGHKYLVENAVENFDSVYIAILENPDKVCVFSVADRVNMIEKALKYSKLAAKVEYYKGLTVDFCRKYGIKYIIRGVRGQADLEYEKEMARFNKENGGVETLLIPARDCHISSGLVKEYLKECKPINGLVCSSIIKDVSKER